MAKIRVAQVVISLAPAGMEQVVKILSLGLHRDDFLVSVICCMEKGPLATELEDSGISVVVPQGRRRFFSLLYPGFLLNALKEVKPDIVHCHSGCWYLSSRAAKMAETPVLIHTEHGRELSDNMLAILMDRLAATNTDSVVCVSKNLSQYMKNRVRISQNLLNVVLNGIDVAKFPPCWETTSYPLRSKHHFSPEDTVLITVGRMEAVKGHLYLLRAFAQLKKKHHSLRLWILGDGTLRVKTQALIQDLGLSRDISLPGSVSNVSAYLKESNLFILPSLSEGTSMAMIEAMASGLPIIASNVGGNSSIFSKIRIGTLVPPASVPALERAIEELIANKALRGRFGRRARLLAHEEYDFRNMLKQYEHIYEKCLKRKTK